MTLAQDTASPARHRTRWPSHRALVALAEPIAKAARITVPDLRGEDKSRRYAWPRQAFMAAALDAGYSSPTIAEWLHGRDHTTVLYGARRHRERQA